jgi:hypothetical protein
MDNSNLKPNVFRQGARKTLISGNKRQQQVAQQPFFVQPAELASVSTVKTESGSETINSDMDKMKGQQALEAKSQEEQDEIRNAHQMYSVRSSIKKALTTSTLHRLGSIFENESILLKIIIGLFFLTSTSICCYYVVKAIMTYAAYGNLTVGTTFYEIPAEFPGISLNKFYVKFI